MDNLTNIIIAIIVSFPALLAWRASKRNANAISENTTQTINNAKAIYEVHLSINSRMTELLEATRGKSKALGKEEGKIEERREVAQRSKDENL